jgi:hypothetical protein
VYVQKETKMTSINLLGNSSDDPNDPNYDAGSDDSTDDDSGLQQCEQKISGLESRVAAIEKKLGMGSGMLGPKAPASPLSGASSSLSGASGKAASPFYGG